MTETMSTLTTYLIAMRDSRGATIGEDNGPDGVLTDKDRARKLYGRVVTTFESGGFDTDCCEIALVKLTGRTRTVIASTKPQTARAKAQLALGGMS